MNEDLEKRMRAALERAAEVIDSATELLLDSGDADEEDVQDERDFANECRALAKEGVK